jgi:hypothetical protein
MDEICGQLVNDERALWEVSELIDEHCRQLVSDERGLWEVSE